MSKHFDLILLTVTILLTLFLIPLPKELDFYHFHVWECQQAHAENMTYLVCSGFWKEPDPSDFDNPCAVHPLEDPYTNIAHGSNLGTTVTVYGIIGYLLTDTNVYPPKEG